FGVEEAEHVLIRSLREIDVAPEQIDVIVLSHLHFDHAGGLLCGWAPGAEPALAFPNAHYLDSRGGWERALSPHPRDRASFIPALQPWLGGTGRLEIVVGEHSAVLGEGYTMSYSDGHTPGLMLTRVDTPHGRITFMG